MRNVRDDMIKEATGLYTTLKMSSLGGYSSIEFFALDMGLEFHYNMRNMYFTGNLGYPHDK